MGCKVVFVSHRGRQGGLSLSNLFTQSSCVGTGGDGGEMASKGHSFQPIAVQSDGYPKALSTRQPLRDITIEVSGDGLVWGFVLVVFSDLALSPAKVPQGCTLSFSLPKFCFLTM